MQAACRIPGQRFRTVSGQPAGHVLAGRAAGCTRGRQAPSRSPPGPESPGGARAAGTPRGAATYLPFFGFFVVPLAGAFEPFGFAGLFDFAEGAFLGAGFFSTFGGSGGGGGGAT